MLRLHTAMALFLWYFFLLHRRALADEEALWGSTPVTETPPEKKSSSYWWKPSLPKLPSLPKVPSLPKLPSLPSLPFGIPFYGRSDSKDEALALTTAAEGLTESSNHSQDRVGSREVITSEDSQLPTELTQAVVTSVTETRTESLPTETSASPHSSTDQTHKDAVVSSTNSFIISTSSANTPTSTSTSEPTGTHTDLPPTTTEETQLSMGTTMQHLKDISERISSTIPPETTVPTALTWTPAQTSTQNLGLVESTLSSTHIPIPITHPTYSETTFESLVDVSTSTSLHSVEPTQTQVDLNFSETMMLISPTLRIDHKIVLESTTSTTQSQWASFPITGEPPSTDDKGEGVAPSAADDADPSTSSSPHRSTGFHTAEWMSSPTNSDVTLLPDCNKERSALCNFTYTWEAATTSDIKHAQNITATNRSSNPLPIPAQPMLVPLYTDWNSAMAVWGLAWEVHVYGASCFFAILTLASALNLLCLPLRCPSGCGYFALVSLFLLAAGCTRSFSLLYDAYGHQDRIPSVEASLMLYEAPFPCLTAAFGLVFLLLSMRSRMQLSYSAFQRPCFLACLVVLHFAAAFGPVTLLKLYRQKPPLCLFLSLISRGAFVGLSTFLSTAYFVFYIYVRADSKHIYHLNNTSPTPAERYNRCPFAESRDWNRAAVTVCVSALFSLACAGLQLYAMLNAMGIAGGEEVFHPWSWWAFQFSCRLCELGVCLTLALVVAQPVYCSDQLPAAGSCWTELLASKSPILPGSYQWSLSQQEKLAIVDTVGLGETESLPLYTLMDERLSSSLNGLDLLYHSNRALAYRDLEADLDLQGSEKPEDGGGREPSGGSSFTSDSTTDLRPPSPINLRRSIDEALFSEALFPMSLFSPTRSFRCSEISVNNHWTLSSKGVCDPLSADTGLYRTSSCLEMASQPQPEGEGPTTCSSSSGSSPERWRGSSSSCSLYRASLGGSSLVLCPTPERQLLREGGTGHLTSSDPQRNYQTLGAASQESLDLSTEADRSVQEEFMIVCRQIDALSICSETIDL